MKKNYIRNKKFLSIPRDSELRKKLSKIFEDRLNKGEVYRKNGEKYIEEEKRLIF